MKNITITVPATPTQGALRISVLQALASLGPGEHLPADVINLVVKAVAPEGGENAKKVRVAAGNSVWDLRQRRCLVNSGRKWILGPEAQAVLEGGPWPERSAVEITVFKGEGSGENEGSSSDGSATPDASEAGGSPVPAAPATPATPAPKRRLKIASLGTNAPPETWVNDPLLTAMVAASWACYGCFSTTHPACGACPIAATCRNAQAGALSYLAASLRDSELPVSAEVAGLQVATGTALNPKTARAEAQLKEGTPYPVPYDTLDCVSGKMLSAQTMVYLHPGLGVSVNPPTK